MLSFENGYDLGLDNPTAVKLDSNSGPYLVLHHQADRSHQDNRDRSRDIGALSQTLAASTN